jgi:CheY-like chemotaxis protein
VAKREQRAMLMAEDDDNDVYFIERAFKEAQITTPLQRVKDGQEAMDYLRGEGKFTNRTLYPLPRMLLLDLKMPRKSGFEVIEWVRKQPGLKRLPIVILTSSLEDPDVNRAYELGANTYLVKPVKFESLVKLVKALHLFWLESAEQPSVTK